MRILAISIAFLACTHDTPPSAPSAPSAPTAAPAAPAAPPTILPAPQHPAPLPTGKVGWSTWTHERKLEYMKSTVLPRARVLFAQWMPVRFAKMDCDTCHGAGGRDGTFRMPNPDLPKLVGGRAGFGEMATHEHEATKFMQQTLAPEMADLLGYQRFDMASHTGFSCYQCHVEAGTAD